MRTNQIIGPRRPIPQTEYWICLKCGIEQESPDFLQCENGQLINNTLKDALAALCCSEELIKLLIPPYEKKTPPSTKKTKNEIEKALAEGLFEHYDKKYYKEFLSPGNIPTIRELINLSKKNMFTNEEILRLLNIFKPLLTNPEITKFHSSTRVCKACYTRLRKEKYDGSDKIPEIPCPICKAILK